MHHRHCERGTSEAISHKVGFEIASVKNLAMTSNDIIKEYNLLKKQTNEHTTKLCLRTMDSRRR